MSAFTFVSLLLVKIRLRLIEQLLHGRLLQHKPSLFRVDSSNLTIEELPLRRKLQRRSLLVLEELVGEGAEMSDEI